MAASFMGPDNYERENEMNALRADGRTPDTLRPITIELGVQPQAAGSALIRWGNTHVLCAASVENRVPPYRLDSGGGWLTAEYAMLPGCSGQRARRERGKVKGRTAEIQRLIGRSLRATVDLDALGQRTIHLDCDVINADGGTRCASITGAYVAACIAMHGLARADEKPFVPPQLLAAVSIGLLEGQVLTDLMYTEDYATDVDLNFVASSEGIVEVQGTAEGAVFDRGALNTMLDAAEAACTKLFALQREVLARVEIIV
jgi:ribonuclease PH